MSEASKKWKINLERNKANKARSLFDDGWSKADIRSKMKMSYYRINRALAHEED